MRVAGRLQCAQLSSQRGRATVCATGGMRAVQVRVLVAAAKATGADFLTPGNDYFNGLKAPSPDQAALGRWMPLGASPAVGFYQVSAAWTNPAPQSHTPTARSLSPEE
jgi:hypothetical protein